MKRNLPTSAFLLVITNILPLIGVLVYNWNLIDILFLYWAESGVIGFWSISRILFAKFDNRGPVLIFIVLFRIFACLFFFIHFGGFMAGHGIILYTIAVEFLKMNVHPLELLRATWIILAILFISHGYSFVTNYLMKGEKDRERGKEFMIDPYKRIFVMHFTLVCGMGPVIFLKQPVYLLVTFIVLKTSLDLWAHLKERSRF
jgi:Family of unknown function (DUF6498)